MATEQDARGLVESLVGRQISTVTGRPNTVLKVADGNVIVGTGRSPDGELVPIDSVQSGLDRLLEVGEVEVSPHSLGYRSSFVGAVLLTHSIRKIRLHGIRHTTASLLKDLKVPPRDAQIILGHAHISTTQQIYTHVDEAARRKALTRLNKLLGGTK
jgi:hypothetical protein